MSSPRPTPQPASQAERKIWLSLAVLVACLVTIGLFMPLPGNHRAFGAIGDLFHTPLFAALTFGLLAIVERIWPIAGWPSVFFRRMAIIGLTLFAIGSGVEWAQEFFGRSAAWHDAIANGMGILAACGLFTISRSRSAPHALVADTPRRRKLTRWVVMGMIACVAIAWWDPIRKLNDVANVYRRFPMLSSFESRYEMQRWFFRGVKRKLSAESPTHGRRCIELKVKGPAGQPGDDICGATLFELDGDWSGMTALSLDVRLSTASDPLPLLIKVVDEPHANNDDDVFQLQTELVPGQWTNITIPARDIRQGPRDRSMDFQRIRYLDVFLLQPPAGTRWWIDHVHVVR